MRRRQTFSRVIRSGSAAGKWAIRARKRIACISSTYHVRSHSDNFMTRFFEKGYWIDEKYYEPAFRSSLALDGSSATREHRQFALRMRMEARVTKTISRCAHTWNRKNSPWTVSYIVCEHGN